MSAEAWAAVSLILIAAAIVLMIVWLLRTADELDPFDERGYSDAELARGRRQEMATVHELHPRGRFQNVSVPEPVRDRRSIYPCHPGDDAA